MTLPDYLIIIFYLGLMVFIGIRYRNASSNFSDYIRMGSRSVWWLTGFSVFMQGFSAITFTGICGSAYLAGWSVLVIFWCNALMFFLQAWLFAPMLRRTRADTQMDALKLRFGSSIEQFLSYLGTITSFAWGGTFLLSLAAFLSVVFHLPLWALILVVGGVVVFYSVSGGSWSVQITDSLQAIILLPVTVVFAALCLHRIGGIGGLFEAIEAAGLGGDFALIKPIGHEYQTSIPVEKGMFSGLWVIAMVIGSTANAANLQTCGRYLSLTDERGAQKAALLAGVLMICGSLIWFVPPVVGRLLFSGQVEAIQGLGNQSDAAYAVTAINILPPGLLGLIVVAMGAATMSSMDSFLTGSSGVIIKNIYLPMLRVLKKRIPSPESLLRRTRWVSLILGAWAICTAFFLNKVSGTSGIFGIMMTTIALIASPTSFPIILSLLFRKIPLWGFYFGMITGFCASLTIFVLQRNPDFFLSYHGKIFVMMASTMIPTLFSRFFWKTSSREFRDLVDNFFRQVNEPIIVSEEVGEPIDDQLLTSVGTYVLLSSVAVGLLAFAAKTQAGLIAVLCVSAVLLTLGVIMYTAGKRIHGKHSKSRN